MSIIVLLCSDIALAVCMLWGTHEKIYHFLFGLVSWLPPKLIQIIHFSVISSKGSEVNLMFCVV